MGKLDDYSLDQVAGALALTLGSIGGLCLILFKSRCEKISICWGIWTCDRKVSDEDTEEVKKDEVKKDEPLLPVPSPEPEPEPQAVINP